MPKIKLPIQCCSPPFVPMHHHVSCLCGAAEGEASGRLDGELTIIIVTLPKMHRGQHSTYIYSSYTYFSFMCQKAQGTKCKARPESNGANPTLVEPCLRDSTGCDRQGGGRISRVPWPNLHLGRYKGSLQLASPAEAGRALCSQVCKRSRGKAL